MKRPIELFRFYTDSGEHLWNVTSRAQPYLASDGITYVPEPIIAPAIESTGSVEESTVDIECAPTFGLLKLFAAGLPAEQISVDILREDEVTKERIWILRAHVLAVSPLLTGSTITCNTVLNATTKNLLSNSFRAQCNHVLFDRKCGLVESEWRDELVISEMTDSGMVLTINSERADDYYTNGLLTFGNYRRMVVAHSDNKIQILGAMDGLKVGDSVYVTKGCDRSYASCSEFSNEVNFFGFPHVPNSNLFANGFVRESI